MFGSKKRERHLPREVASVEHAHPSDLDHEHCSAEHVPRIVAAELDASVGEHLVRERKRCVGF